VPFTKNVAQAVGTPMVYATTVSGSAASYTSQCLAARAAGANVLVVGSDSNTDIRVYQSCAQQGYQPIAVQGSSTVSADYATQPFFQGKQFVQDDFPWFDNSTPATRAFQSALQKYAPSVTHGVTYNGVDAQTWAAAEVFKAAAIAGKWGNSPTYADVKNGFYALPKGDTFGGLTPPLTFSPNHTPANLTNTVNCYFVIGVENNKFTEPQGLKTNCVSPSL
jgi:branched-chain amino acid transport system substrate-binding protein